MRDIRFSHCIGLVLLTCLLLGKMQTKAESPNRDKEPKNGKEHFYYALPLNYFTITVKVAKTSTFEGPLKDYAGKVTGLSYLVKENAVHYQITEVNLEVHSQMDKQHIYYVEVPAGEVSFWSLYKNLLLSAYVNPQEKAGKSQATVSTAGKLYTENRFNIYTADAMMEKYDTTYVSQIMDTTIVQIPKITKRLVAKPTQQQAQEAINEIKKIREAYWLLISGDHETDFSNLERMLQELKQKENEYLSLFGGTIEEEELTYTFTVVPAKEGNNSSIPLFYFSEKEGIISTEEDPHRMEYTLKLNLTDIQNSANQAKETFLKTKSDKEKANAQKEQKSEGLYYRNPAYYSVSLYNGINLVENFGIYPVAQFGEIMTLPASVHAFEIDPLTGALFYLETKK